MCTSRGLDDARRLREPSEAGSVDLVVLRDEGRNTSADVWREPVDAEPRDAVDHGRVRGVRGGGEGFRMRAVAAMW